MLELSWSILFHWALKLLEWLPTCGIPHQWYEIDSIDPLVGSWRLALIVRQSQHFWELTLGGVCPNFQATRPEVSEVKMPSYVRCITISHHYRQTFVQPESHCIRREIFFFAVLWGCFRIIWCRLKSRHSMSHCFSQPSFTKCCHFCIMPLLFRSWFCGYLPMNFDWATPYSMHHCFEVLLCWGNVWFARDTLKSLFVPFRFFFRSEIYLTKLALELRHAHFWGAHSRF